jgi:hypothetical protein
MKYGLDEVGILTLDDEAFTPRGRNSGMCVYGGGGGGKSKKPAPPPPPPPPPPPAPVPVPTVDEAKDAADNSDKIRRRRGLASTILAGGNAAGAAGDLATVPTQSGAKLLGQ